jgi:hypothetical protein
MHLENVGNPAVYSAKAQQLFKTAGLPRRLAEEVRSIFSFSFKRLMSLLAFTVQLYYQTHDRLKSFCDQLEEQDGASRR